MELILLHTLSGCIALWYEIIHSNFAVFVMNFQILFQSQTKCQCEISPRAHSSYNDWCHNYTFNCMRLGPAVFAIRIHIHCIKKKITKYFRSFHAIIYFTSVTWISYGWKAHEIWWTLSSWLPKWGVPFKIQCNQQMAFENIWTKYIEKSTLGFVWKGKIILFALWFWAMSEGGCCYWWPFAEMKCNGWLGNETRKWSALW